MPQSEEQKKELENDFDPKKAEEFFNAWKNGGRVELLEMLKKQGDK